MSNSNFPVYTESKHKGNIGEAIAQYFLSKFSLVHKIDGSNDLGNDFICELIKDQAPTNLLFYIQVKFTKNKPVTSNSTKEYWKYSPIPVFIIWIKVNDLPLPSDPEELSNRIKYIRMTPMLHDQLRHGREKYKPYNEIEFKRDLIVDYVRTQYVKGFTPIVEPRDYLTIDDKNLAGIGRYALYIKDVIPEYRGQIMKRAWVQNFVVAELLFREGGTENYGKALQSINLSLSLISGEDREELFGYYQKMIDLKNNIQNQLNKKV
ncbi:DUF4365 domain-containing protein [Patescibacteria group bacterium]|nr:DUF4365 domain-containing protein [Patescibacteria group bacterium]MBU4455160.1 DUF4365 domain-containing protein [Patescibacteria group bacterium]